MLSWIGWVATAVFAISYRCKRPATLRRVQAAAAVLWVIYGVLIHAFPVIVANLIVAGMALYSSFGVGVRRGSRSRSRVWRSIRPASQCLAKESLLQSSGSEESAEQRLQRPQPTSVRGIEFGHCRANKDGLPDVAKATRFLASLNLE